MKESDEQIGRRIPRISDLINPSPLSSPEPSVPEIAMAMCELQHPQLSSIPGLYPPILPQVQVGRPRLSHTAQQVARTNASITDHLDKQSDRSSTISTPRRKSQRRRSLSPSVLPSIVAAVPNHLPIHVSRRYRCAFCMRIRRSRQTRIYCPECDVGLCIGSDKSESCFGLWHGLVHLGFEE
jgi:hypothetical protein